MNILSSAFGRYDVTGDLSRADCLVGHSFGTLVEKGSVNHSLAEQMLLQADGRPIIVDRKLADAFPDSSIEIDHIAGGPISNTIGTNGGTWQTLLSANEYMNQENLSLALMFAQASHIGRVLLQSRKLGIDSIAPSNLPNHYDVDSNQWWTRSKALWIPREIIGSVILRAQKKL